MAMILLSNLSFGYEGSYQPVFEDLSIALDTDWCLGLTGRNGRGKTTLLRLLLGAQGAAYGLRLYRQYPDQSSFRLFSGAGGASRMAGD